MIAFTPVALWPCRGAYVRCNRSTTGGVRMTDSRCTRSTVPWIWFNIYTRWKVHMKCHMLHVNGIRGFFFSLPLRIIYPCAHDMPYTSAIFLADLPTMSDRRDQLTRKLFKTTTQPTSSLHYFLPPPRDHPSITRLRVSSKFPRISTRTKKNTNP